GVLEAGEAAPADELVIEGRDPGLGHRVVVGVGLGADRGVDLELVEPIGVAQTRVLGGFNWSSQRLVMEVVSDGCSVSSAGGSRDAGSDVVAGAAVGCAAGGSAAVLAGDRRGLVERGGGRRCGGVAGGWQPVVPRRWRDAANLVGPAVGALSVVC